MRGAEHNGRVGVGQVDRGQGHAGFPKAHLRHEVNPALGFEATHRRDSDMFLGRQETTLISTGQAFVAHQAGEVGPFGHGGFAVERLVLLADGLGNGRSVGGEKTLHRGHRFDDGVFAARIERVHLSDEAFFAAVHGGRVGLHFVAVAVQVDQLFDGTPFGDDAAQLHRAHLPGRDQRRDMTGAQGHDGSEGDLAGRFGPVVPERIAVGTFGGDGGQDFCVAEGELAKAQGCIGNRRC